MQIRPFFRPLKSGSLALVASAVLMAGAASAHAGTSEVAALQAALTTLGDPPLNMATSQQLLDAFKAVLALPGGKFDTTKEFGVVVGEALKAAGPNASDAGAVFANAIKTDAALAAVLTDKIHFISLSAKTAGTGKGLNVLQIPGLTAGLISTDADAQTAAEGAANKPGSGAILGGRASQLANDAAKTTFANLELTDTKLTAAAQDIAHYIGATVADSAAFAVHLADGNTETNLKLAISIAIGVAAGNPTNAGNIAHTLFNEQILNPNGTLSAPTATPSAGLLAILQKGAAKLAASMAAVADIEEIQKIGNAIGQQIAMPNPLKPTVGLVKLSQAAPIVKALSAAIMSKPRGTNVLGDPNSDANKRDEIAEVAAYMLGGLIGSPELAALAGTKDKTAATDIMAIITAAAGTKPKVTKLVANGPTSDTFAADVAASVALTVATSSLPASIKLAVQNLLLFTDANGNHTSAAKINKLAATQIFNALSDVYSNTNVSRFENGNDPAGAVSDPETDIHPFS